MAGEGMTSVVPAEVDGYGTITKSRTSIQKSNTTRQCGRAMARSTAKSPVSRSSSPMDMSTSLSMLRSPGTRCRSAVDLQARPQHSRVTA